MGQERFAGIRTVRAFGHDQYEEAKYGELVTRVQQMTEKEARAQSTLFSFNPFMGNMLLVQGRASFDFLKHLFLR